VYVDEQKIDLWQAAIDYEISLSGWSQDEVWAYAEKLLDISLASIEGGMNEGLEFKGIVKPMGSKLARDFLEKPLLPMGIMNYAVPAALAVMEHSNAHGIIVCMPTGGSSGIIPGVIYAVGREGNVSKTEKIKALLVAGLVGSFMFETNYSGEIGCQAEVGCSTAMAAAALTHFMAPDTETCCNSASLAIQSLLGLICDPVAGLVQIPCMIRNMTAVAIATVVANVSVCGFQAVIPLDEMIDSILKVGTKIRFMEEYGASGTPTGCRLANQYNKK
jgi:L-serine dehydratase